MLLNFTNATKLLPKYHAAANCIFLLLTLGNLLTGNWFTS